MKPSVVGIIFLCLPFFLNAQGSEQNSSENLSENLSMKVKPISLKLDVEKYQLENGLTVLLYVDRTVPIVSYQTWFRVGSKDEKPGTTGLAHFLEHLMFKGAKRYTGKQFDRILQANGITNNAFTSHDYTGYYENLPSSSLEIVMDMESDRMENLALREQDFLSEKEVVREERRMSIDDNPTGKIREVTYRTVFRVNPYRWPIIGFMRDLSAITIKDLRAFWEKFYSPNNAILVIAGDINKKQVKKLVKKYYGSISSSLPPKRMYSPEPEQRGQRSVILRRNIKRPYFSVAYKIPGASNEDVYALDLLSNILGSGHSSRLYKRLVYKAQTASQIHVYSYTPKEAGLFGIYGAIPAGDDYTGKLERTIRGVYSEIWRVRNKLVTDEELYKAKNQVMTSYVNSLTTVSGKANILALNEALFGSYEIFLKDLERYNAVTVEDVKRVAMEYLAPSKRSVVRLFPKKVEDDGAGDGAEDKQEGEG